MADHDRIGARVAGLRKAAGLTQIGLARRANVSYSLLTKVEAGHRPASPVFVGATARALRVDVTDVTGQPYRGREWASDRVHASVAEVRRALSFPDLAPELDVPPRSAGALSAAVGELVRLQGQVRQDRKSTRLNSSHDQISY